LNLNKYFSLVVEKWFGGVSKRPFIDYAINRINEKWSDRRIFLVEAPTGYGKSTISASLSLYSIREELKSIIAFPLRTLLEDQYNKFLKLFNRRILGKRYMHHPDSPYLIKPVTLTTIDTLSLVLFGIAPEDIQKVTRYYMGTSRGSLGHYLFSWSSIALSNLILDEVHLLSDSTKSLNFLITLLKVVEDNDQRLILMSATVPNALKKVIKSYIDKPEFISFDESFDTSFTDNRKRKKYDTHINPLKMDEKLNKIFEWMIDEYKRFQRVLVIFNTVRDAVNFYSFLNEKLSLFDLTRNEIILLHSRFSEKDRERKNCRLNNIKKGNRYIIVATQVVEAGIDISSNLLITELAPANSLIQRIGRFLRYEDELEGSIYIWYEVNEKNELLKSNGRYKVYDWELTNRTLKALEEKEINFHLPSGYRDFLEKVYTINDFEVDIKAINDLRRILLNFEYGSLISLEKFFELEGSFVRESSIVPIVVEKLIEKHRKEDVVELEVEKFSQLTIPISINFLFKLEPEKMIALSEGKLVIQDVSPRFFKYHGVFVRNMVRNNIQAFIVPAKYSEEKGLTIGGEDE